MIGTLLADRYRLDRCLSSDPDHPQGTLWRAADQLAGDAPVALRQLNEQATQDRFRRLWPSMQSLLHPQIPRFGGLLEEQGCLWLVREWQEGSSLSQIQTQRLQRQLVFGAGEVLLLMRQLLPPLAVLHGQELVHGDLNPRNLLRRDQDCLPVLLDFGLLQRCGQQPLTAATPAFAPRAQVRQDPAAAWMDLHGLGVSALTLLTGRPPAQLLQADAEAWQLPNDLDLEPAYRQVLERLLSEQPERRFEVAADALQALQAVSMPETTGPQARAERTLVLAPAVPDDSPPVVSGSPDLPRIVTPSGQESRRRPSAEQRQLAAEGRLWPVVGALLISALVGTAIGWFLLTRGNPPAGAPSTERDVIGRSPSASLPPAEVDQRQQLLSRLRALQVDRSWFLQLVDASLMARFPERGGRLPSDSLEDAPLRSVWNELAEEWLARVEQLPPVLRSRLGQLKPADWQRQRQALVSQGVNSKVVEQLVSASAQALLPGVPPGVKPPEPFRQLWIAAALRSLEEVRIEQVKARAQAPTVLSSRVSAGGARLISISVPAARRLVLGINGTPLMQMTVYGANGEVAADRGPLRVVTLPVEAGSPVQVLVTNDGVSSGLLTLSCRADAPAPTPLPEVDLNPIPDPATGAEGPVEALPEPSGPRPAGAEDPPVEETDMPSALPGESTPEPTS
ncbi:serine/threonine protein kinase [Synechococcus sp. BIOS-U3-1]|nr:protein kinase [Synechococcus sp. BIOS-U3-1]QNI57078.1 serine/threonine protein kinase [Synechococcus sp. BIOS-U3-1]